MMHVLFPKIWKIRLKLSIKLLLLFLILYLTREINRIDTDEDISKSVWILYEGSYGNKLINNRYYGWEYRSESEKYQKIAPFQIPSVLYPEFGTYSSHDMSVLKYHVSLIKDLGIDSVIFSSNHDNHSEVTLEYLFQAANAYNISIGIQINQYNNISSESLYSDIVNLIEKHGNKNNFLKLNNKYVIIIYESFHIPFVFKTFQKLKENNYEVYLITTFHHMHSIGTLVEDGFDGLYSYFVTDSFTESSDMKKWPVISKSCSQRGISFFPTVGPGYNGDLYNDWADDLKQDRDNGEYYIKMWKNAISLNPRIVIINSFNNWKDGTSIEPAINRTGYMMDQSNWANITNPSYYLHLTKKCIRQFLSFQEI